MRPAPSPLKKSPWRFGRAFHVASDRLLDHPDLRWEEDSTTTLDEGDREPDWMGELAHTWDAPPQGRLSPAFVEWMQGFPAGWVDGLKRTDALKALGNSVVPQQAARAWEMLT